ncbi:MAG: prepilin peptidase [Candidatus Falkowbacteria bacterium]|nr:prepilin peptidase [Candidatus Falkowbacteria bacterium]
MDSLFIVFSLFFGFIIGSFLNCLIWRLYEDESMGGRSHCRSCKKTIAWYDNLPVISYLILGGSCRHCKKHISWQYPIVEALVGLFFMLAIWRLISEFGAIDLWQLNNWLTLLRNWFLISIFTIIFVMDLRWFVIFDRVSLTAAGVVLALNLYLGFSWQSLLISATIGTGFFLVQFIVSHGRWIGGGDIRLGLLLGVAFGWPNVLPAIFLGYGIGAVVGLLLLAFGKKHWGSKLPLGTFLSVSALIVLLYGQTIVNWYLNFINLR